VSFNLSKLISSHRLSKVATALCLTSSLIASNHAFALADGNDIADNEDLNYIFNRQQLPTVTVKITEAQWNNLVAMYDRNHRNEEYVKADFYWQGQNGLETISEIGIRVSGNSNRRRPQGDNIYDVRPFNFKLDFNEYIDDDDHEFHNVNGIKFKARGDDPTYSRDVFAMELMQDFGIWIAPRASFASVDIEIDRGNNGVVKSHVGVYRMVENTSKPFLKKRFGKKNDDGDLWKGGLSTQTSLRGRPDFKPFSDMIKMGEEVVDPNNDANSYYPAYDLKKHKKHTIEESNQQLLDFIDKLNTLEGQAFIDWAKAHMDVSLFLKTMAVDVVLGQTDGYWANTNNFNFYFDEDGIFYFIPMDYDNSQGTTPPGLLNDGATANWNEFTKRGASSVPLISHLLKHSEFLKEYKGYLIELVNDGYITPSTVAATLQGYKDLIGAQVPSTSGVYDTFADNTAWWSATTFYRIFDANSSNNFFQTKIDNINENVIFCGEFDCQFAALSFRGTANGWGTQAMTLVADNVWQTEVIFDEDEDNRFKFDRFGDWTQNYGDDDQNCDDALNCDGSVEQSGEDIQIDQTGAYTITFNDMTKHYHFELQDQPNKAPVADASSDVSVEVGSEVTFSGANSSDRDGNIESYQWTSEAFLAALEGVSPSFVFDTIGEFEVTLTVTDNEGETSSDVIVVTVTDIIENVAPIADAGANIAAIVGDNVSFNAAASTDLDGTIESYSWTSAAFGELTGATPNFVFADAGQFEVTLTVTDNDGASSSDIIEVNVSEAPANIEVQFTCENGDTYWGQNVYVVGSIGELGNWSSANAIQLSATDYPTWTGTISIPANTSFEWKCIKKADGEVTWQSGGNNSINLPASGDASTSGSF